MERLIKWLDGFNANDCHPPWKYLSYQDVEILSDYFKSVLKELFCGEGNPDNKTNYPIRPSMLGKPAMVVAYNYYHPTDKNNNDNLNSRKQWHGHMFELWVAAQLLRMGFEVDLEATETHNIRSTYLTCHVDIIVDNKLIIECKELSDWYWKKWVNYTPDDDRGYKTQAAIYSKAFDMPIMWVLGNRYTGELSYRVQPEYEQLGLYNRAEQLIDVVVNRTNSWEECFKYMQPEPPNVTKKGLTVPFSMKSIADVVYQRDPNGYVLDYKYPLGYEQYKPKLS